MTFNGFMWVVNHSCTHHLTYILALLCIYLLTYALNVLLTYCMHSLHIIYLHVLTQLHTLRWSKRTCKIKQ